MRSTLLIGILVWAVVCVHCLTRVEHPASIQKRAASPQIYRGPPNSTYGGNQSQQFQWVKVNNQWVRADGTRLPGYSPANVPYNQTGTQWNSRSPSPSQPGGGSGWNAQRPGNQSAGAGGWGQQPQQPQQPQQRPPQGPPQQLPRQNSTSPGGLGWNPGADRALTEDRPATTPRPAYTTPTPAPVRPQTPPPAYNPPAYNPPAANPPANAPFGSGVGSRQPQRGYNPDARLTYGGGNVPPGGASPPIKATPRPGANPWGGIFN